MRAWRSMLVALPFLAGAILVALISTLLTTPR
jgi:hypothetical protein